MADVQLDVKQILDPIFKQQLEKAGAQTAVRDVTISMIKHIMQCYNLTLDDIKQYDDKIVIADTNRDIIDDELKELNLPGCQLPFNEMSLISMYEMEQRIEESKLVRFCDMLQKRYIEYRMVNGTKDKTLRDVWLPRLLAVDGLQNTVFKTDIKPSDMKMYVRNLAIGDEDKALHQVAVRKMYDILQKK